MPIFEEKKLPALPDTKAPDGSEVRVLLNVSGRGGMAHFRLQPGQVSRLVTHRTVDEIWYVLRGKGQLVRWRLGMKEPEPVDLEADVCVTIPVGTHFQFRADASTQLDILGVTMPPWPQDREEAVRTVDHWPPNV
jgi:mannose-6-phosphate isomerase-like protein (cupin superfamily)